MPAAGSSTGWIVAIAALCCGFGGAVFLRRWRVSLPIGAGADANYAVAPHRAPNRIFVAAPLPELFDPNPTDDAETFNPHPARNPNAYGTFAAFPGAFEFAPESDTG
jgi:hypothetical protein